MVKWGRVAVRIAVGAVWLVGFVGDVWSITAWIWGGGLKMPEDAGLPEYAALTAMFSVILIVSSWYLVWCLAHHVIGPRMPSQRFKKLSPKIRHLNNMNSIGNLVGLEADLYVLGFRLDKLGIKNPGPDTGRVPGRGVGVVGASVSCG